jgi:riboflavin kinase
MESDLLFLYGLSGLLRDRSDKVSMSSAQLGSSLGMSQQSAARKLKELEEAGYIKRGKSAGIRSGSIELTVKGFDVLNRMYQTLKEFIEEKRFEDLIEGTVSRGLGEGAYYVNEYCGEIKKRLGFTPFPGTLNVKPAGGIPSLDRLLTGTIKGFKKKGRTFGSIRYAKIRLAGKGTEVDCFLIVPARTHHKGTLEIISEYNLREKMGLSDGDAVRAMFIN